jgi:hypothetical protein
VDSQPSPRGPLEIFVIYDHPRDYPGHFVVRRWLGDRPTEDFAIALTLAEARAEVPRGRVRLARSAADDPVIVETWV